MLALFQQNFVLFRFYGNTNICRLNLRTISIEEKYLSNVVLSDLFGVSFCDNGYYENVLKDVIKVTGLLCICIKFVYFLICLVYELAGILQWRLVFCSLV